MVEALYDLTNLGLSSNQVEILLNKHGKNKLPEKAPPTSLELFLSQLRSPLVFVLLAAFFITLFLHEYSDATIIVLAVLINTVLGYVQESRASNSLESLKKMIHPFAQVYRDGKAISVPVETLVPGDVVFLNQGDKIPADGSVLKSNRLYVTESILTGESLPIDKSVHAKVFMGTIVSAGKGVFIVETTGAQTEMGKIAESVGSAKVETPLGSQLKVFGTHLSIVVLILTFIVFVLGIIKGESLKDIFITSVALAVSAIPEGLLVGLTVVLAIGMQRILKRRGLVRNLISAETLGGVTTICVDKTGTLTEGKLQVKEIFGDYLDLATQSVLANDLDDPIVMSAYDWATQQTAINIEDLKRRCTRLDSIPFESETQYYTCLTKWDENSNMLFINGAPEVVIANCSMSLDQINAVEQKISSLSSRGFRLVGFARKQVSVDIHTIHQDKHLTDMNFIGLLGFLDPVRADVRESFNLAKSAGIKIIVITGDYAATAAAVMKELDIEVSDEDIYVGNDVETLSIDMLALKLKEGSTVKLFARTKPQQKLKIVTTLKDNGEVVAMMGDGVNDAPALSQADIGIVVADASDVAKESADLVLLDSDFKTIVAAIEEGRGIFDNIRKIILYLMSDAFEEILVILFVLLLSILGYNLGIPITATQILWINIVSDGFPHLALTVDPKSKGIMQRPPRDPKEPLMSKWVYKLIIFGSLFGALFSTFIYIYILNTTGDEALARSATFATIGIDSLFYVFSIRALKRPIWEISPIDNKWLLLAVFAGLMFLLAPFVIAPLGKFLDLIPLGSYWFLVILASLMLVCVVEATKWFFRHSLK